jgi:hypothetical protein
MTSIYETCLKDEDNINRLKYPWVTGPATTTIIQEVMPEESASLLGVTEQPVISGKQRPSNIVIVLRSSREGDPEKNWIKCYWKSELSQSVIGRPQLFFFEAPEDQVGFSEEDVTSISIVAHTWQHSEPEHKMWRGVFSLSYPKKVLFSQEVEVRTADLPRWKPYITIDRRILAREEDAE